MVVRVYFSFLERTPQCRGSLCVRRKSNFFDALGRGGYSRNMGAEK